MRRTLKLCLAALPLALACGNGAGTNTVSLPFAVDNEFSASGYFGDGATPGLLTDNACAMRAGKGLGKCHSFSWTPGMPTVGYAGVYWLYPENNFGTMVGRALPAGAQSISFYAWGANGGESVTFFAGIKGKDSFYVEHGPITLTTTPTQHWLSLKGTTYTTVIGGFGWDTGQHATNPVVVNIDDIEWQSTPAGESIPGCTNPSAANYNPGATTEDQSCQFLVTFQVDLTGVTLAASDAPEIRSTFNGFCDQCNPLMQNSAAGPNIWTSSLPLAPGTYQFKYALNSSQAGYEVVPITCSANPSASDQERNRSLTVTAAAQTIPIVKFGACP